ncbi:MAG: ACP S-malonyltransferase [Acidobacteria bacterium]|nr:ACP S-malonyltransferase [Acidobacteriota bacterium]
MGRIAALFPGQGSQFVGMGQDVAGRWPAAYDVFERADSALGFGLARLCWEGPEDELRLTANTQPALLAMSIAIWRVLEAGGVRAEAVAGHSLGEYSAIVAAGGLSLEEALGLVRLRGELMQEAVPVGEGAMAAVIGLDDTAVGEACSGVERSGGGIVVPVNFNAPGQVVIAGAAGAVEAASSRCRQLGAKRVIALAVSAPFHSPLMRPAREGLTPALERASFSELEAPLYRNVDARPVRHPGDVREGLVRQVDAPVLWTQTVRTMIADGFDTFIEVGAGTVLSGLVRRVDRSVTCLPAGKVDQIEKVLERIG